jgi:hypothetical protein
VAETTTNRGKTRILAGDTPLDSSDLRMLIFTGTQTGVNDPDLNTVADLDAVSGVAIHSERIALAGKTVTEDDTNNWALADCDNVIFAAAPGVTAQGAAIYDEGGGTDATRFLVSIYTTNFPQPMDGGLTVNTPNGWLRGT